MTVEVHAEEERTRGVNLYGGRAGGVDLNSGSMGGMDLNDGGGARGGGAVDDTPAWSRSAHHRGGCGGGAGTSGCVVVK
jgi:hypothetical protein